MQVQLPESPGLPPPSTGEEEDFSHLLESPTALAAQYNHFSASLLGPCLPYNNSDLLMRQHSLGSPDFSKHLNLAGLIDIDAQQQYQQCQQQQQQEGASGTLLRQLSGGLLLPELVLADQPSSNHATHRLASSADRLYLLGRGGALGDEVDHTQALNSLGPAPAPLTPRAAEQQQQQQQQANTVFFADAVLPKVVAPLSHIALSPPGIHLKPLHIAPLAPGVHHLQMQPPPQAHPHQQQQQQEPQLHPPALLLVGKDKKQEQQQQQQPTLTACSAASALPAHGLPSHSELPSASVATSTPPQEAAPAPLPAAAELAEPADVGIISHPSAKKAKTSTKGPVSGAALGANRLVWAKVPRYPWWPAITISANDPTAAAVATVAPDGSSSGGSCVLVRFLGTHDAAWLDPARAVSSWEQSRSERSSKTKAAVFLQALSEARTFVETGEVPEAFSSPLQLTPSAAPVTGAKTKKHKSTSVPADSPCLTGAGEASTAGSQDAPHSMHMPTVAARNSKAHPAKPAMPGAKRGAAAAAAAARASRSKRLKREP